METLCSRNILEYVKLTIVRSPSNGEYGAWIKDFNDWHMDR